ncbi:MAG: MFS transporter [Candidatus Adiutrix sp.]|nr:MFS transporter [Candidatus Adiutrix sp.]
MPVFCLSLAGFIFVTTELMPIGILPELAREFNQTEAFTGLLVTVYAWSVALLSLPLTMLTAGLNRRTLMLILLGAFTISQGLAAVAASFPLLMAVRLLTALCHSIFWSITPPLAVRVAPSDQPTQALIIIAAVTSLASILGMPLGSLISHSLGWRLVFLLIGLLALLIAVILFKFLPSTPGDDQPKGRVLRGLLSNQPLLIIYALTALTVSGHFTAFTYMRPLLAHNGGFQPSTVAALLLTLGCAGVLGNLIVNKFFFTRPRLSLVAALIILALALALANPASSFLAGAFGLCLVWGASLGAVCLVFQTNVLQKAAESQDVGNSIYSAIFNVGIGGGALMGNQVFNHLGVMAVTRAGAALVVAAVILALIAAQTKPARSQRP